MQDKKIKELFEEISKLKDGKNSVEEILKEMQNVDIVNNLEYIKNEIIEPEGDSPLSAIGQKIYDLANSDIDLDDLVSYFNNHQNLDYWNESINTLYNNYKKYLEDKEQNVIPVSNGRVVEWKEIGMADAANSFEAEQKWVIPWFSIFDRRIENEANLEELTPEQFKDYLKSYSDIRDIDKFMKAIMSKNNLQFTHEKQNEELWYWIRLIMPKNTRRVEVEDLNRNFWVIAQTLSGIMAYLWDTKSPITNLLKGIYDELLQLWENVFYLWLYYIYTMAAKINGIHIEFLYLSESPHEKSIELRFDNFSKIETIDYMNEDYCIRISSYLKELIKKYPDKHLCIIPCIREKNYEKNYFSSCSIPMIYFYDRAKGESSIKMLAKKVGNTVKPFKVGIYGAYKNDVDYSSYLYGWCDNGKKELISYPFNHISAFSESVQKKYYCALRILPEIDLDYINGEFVINSLSFTLIDAVQSMLKNRDMPIAKWEGTGNTTILLEETKLSNEITRDRKSYAARALRRRFYLGEVLSAKKWSKLKTEYLFDGIEQIGAEEGILIKIGNYLPNSTRINNSSFYSGGKVEGLDFTPQVTASNSRTNYLFNFVRTALRTGSTPSVKDSNGNSYSSSDVSNSLIKDCNFYIPCQMSELQNYDHINISGEVPISNAEYYWNIVDEEINSEEWNSFTSSFIPYITNKKELRGYLPATSISLRGLRLLGFYIIMNYLLSDFKNNNSKLDSKNIQIFLSAFGGNPWVGGTMKYLQNQSKKITQFYFKENMLLDNFVYVPKSYITNEDFIKLNNGLDIYKDSLNSEQIASIQGIKVGEYGYLLYRGYIRKSEINFGRASSSNLQTKFNENLKDNLYLDIYNGDRWRLPQINNIPVFSSIIKVKEVGIKDTNSFYLIYDKTLQTLYETDPESFSDYIDTEINKEDSQLIPLTKEEALKKLGTMLIKDYKAKWTVFDGYTNYADGTAAKNNILSQNLITTGLGSTYDELAEFTFAFYNGNIGPVLKTGRLRSIIRDNSEGIIRSSWYQVTTWSKMAEQLNMMWVTSHSFMDDDYNPYSDTAPYSQNEKDKWGQKFNIEKLHDFYTEEYLISLGIPEEEKVVIPDNTNLTSFNYGIDVSEAQKTINWNTFSTNMSSNMANATFKRDFVIIKAGYGKYTSQIDQQFANNVNGCKTNSIPFGLYYQAYAQSEAEAEQEAQTFLSIANGICVPSDLTLPVYYEYDIINSNAGNIIEAFCRKIEQAGFTPGLYINESKLYDKIKKNKDTTQLSIKNNTYIKNNIVDRKRTWVKYYPYKGANGMPDAEQRKCLDLFKDEEGNYLYGIWQYSNGTETNLTKDNNNQLIESREINGISTNTTINRDILFYGL